MNNLIKIILFILLVFFLSLYFSNYTTSYNENKKVLTEEAIKDYEKDLQEGKEIIPGNYIVKEKNYNNKVAMIGMKTSKFIENSFHKIIKWMMKNISKYTE